ncbi:methyltransferase domain-containing protein [Mucilaginibacter terrigena]|uniref:Methyltransferase domain-containing protein n=1 Tax=Mucilaginibacter terrigena TaxID=2492395 RepID=A0A4Q5LMI9_9SPHI|nr:class I SAM-dependent methyltransferase [Mucilaginibacter terrigena]RYU90373.1 methyltransferase domain-containing protein [Mucilaginibacter terrigena]
MPGNYDNSARFYDTLSRLVFGRALVDAQVYLLPHIPKNSNIIIAGGGTGWVLEEITKLHPAGLSITYVELSANMMAISRKRNTGQNKITWINKGIEQLGLSPDFDMVITPFLFDNFTEATLPVIFTHIHQALKPGGHWLYTDFQLTGKWWQYAMLKSMLLFFKILCGVQSWRLPNVAGQFNNYGYEVVDEKSFFGEFVVSKVYKKPVQ